MAERSVPLDLFALLAMSATVACSSARKDEVEQPRIVNVRAIPAIARRALRVGDVAPALEVDTWVKGGPLASHEEDDMHVVVFWSTWCKPCLTSLPYVTALQRDYVNVQFIGVAANERAADPKNDDRLERLREFVAHQGNRIAFRVAYDADGSSRTAWCDEAGEEALPRAFLVDSKGRIAWIGHPMEIDRALQAALLASR